VKSANERVKKISTLWILRIAKKVLYLKLCIKKYVKIAQVNKNYEFRHIIFWS